MAKPLREFHLPAYFLFSARNVVLIALVMLRAVGALGQSSASPTFSVSFSKELSAKAIDGRMLLMLSTDPSEEPRMQINDTPRTQMVFGVNVDGRKPGQEVTFDDKAWGYPVRSLRDVPPGEYYVQALLYPYETFHRFDGKTVKL